MLLVRTSICLFLCLFLFISCDDTYKEIFVQNEFSQEVYFIDKDSLRQGKYVELSVDGKDTIAVAKYKDDKYDGKRKIYNKEGKVITIESYKNGVFHGEELTFYPNGTIHTRGNFTNGLLDSIFYVYYDSGELKERVTMKDNTENGPFEEYYKNGKVHWKGTFIDGNNEVGILYEYDEQGELIKKMDCGKYLGEYICQTIWEKGKGDVEAKLKYDE